MSEVERYWANGDGYLFVCGRDWVPKDDEFVLWPDFKRVQDERDALQHRLTTADQRIDELEGVAGEALLAVEGGCHAASLPGRMRATLAGAPVPPQADAQPVAYLCNGGTRLLLAKDKQEAIWNAGRPLYTHADAGEVERLRTELKTWKTRAERHNITLHREIDKARSLRAQLAERDALLREADEFMYIMTDHDHGARLSFKYGEKWWDTIDKLRGRICTALFASAEPGTFAGMKVVADPALAPDEIRIVHPKP